MAVGSWFYAPIVSAFENKGWETRVLPRRGFERGEATAGPEHDWSYGDEAQVVEAAVVEARQENPDRPVIVVGHSLGGHLGTAVQLGENPADGLVTIGTSTPHYRYYGIRAVGLLVLAAIVKPIARRRGYLRKPFFGAPGARTLMTEWADMILTGNMPFDVPKLVDRPTLSIHLQKDSFSIKPAVRHFERSSFAPSALTTWTYLKRDTPPGGTTHHVHWVREPAPVVDYIVDWWAEQNATVEQSDFC